ncbi:MAG: glycine cleavage system aminomethyltransferase GcvT [Chitinophagales bacterium]|nr:glycine cleavage system aminomethyltransferase GcvT [Chitinophagales bacterium]
MKTTALTEVHMGLGAKMVEFAGYNMPVSYTGINEEHNTVRNSVGVFDVSHMGEFVVSGKGALELVQYVTTNDASKLSPGKAQYSCMPNGRGGIVDDLLVYMLAEEEYLLVVNASNIEKDWAWIESHNRFGAKMENISDNTSLLAVQGPKAMATLQKLTSVNLSEIPYYHFRKGTFAGVDGVIISNTGYTGAGGFELYFPNEAAKEIWEAIFKAGAEFAIKPIGLGARDTLRLEKAFCLYGNDIDDTTSPLEAGLGWITKLDKGDFVDAAYLKAQKEKGLTHKLVGFEMVDKGIPRNGYPILDAQGNSIGRVTSGTMSPSLQKAIGMGYVKTAFTSPGSEIVIEIRDRQLKASVVKTPFL